MIEDTLYLIEWERFPIKGADYKVFMKLCTVLENRVMNVGLLEGAMVT